MEQAELDRLQGGDRQIFAELVRDHHRALIALATPIVGISEAEEVVQNAWVKAYRAVAGFEGRASIRTWLSRIVINEARMLLRARKKESLFAEIGTDETGDDVLENHFNARGHWQKPPVSWHFESPEALLMGADFEQCLEKLLAQMPAGQRFVLEMRDTGEIPFDEICNTLSVSASNARVLLHRARAQLYRLVDHYQETGEC